MPWLDIVFLGTGNAFNTDGRGCQCVWLAPRGIPPLVVDLGPTALAAMGRFGLDPASLDHVFFTHFHGDHTAGWPFFLLHAAFVAKRTRPLVVFGAPGLRSLMETLVLGSFPELLTPEKLPFPVEYREVPVARRGGIQPQGGVSFDVVPLEHHATSIGFRIRVNGLTVGISGDTSWCPALEELAQGCDAFIVECSSVEKQAYAHVSLEEIREHAPRLGSKRVFLVHITDEVARALRDHPIPGVQACHDGMRVEL